MGSRASDHAPIPPAGNAFLCEACGTSYESGSAPPDACGICQDERQFVPSSGQSWTDRPSLARSHRNAWACHEPGLFSLHTVPAFAINQRAFLLVTPAGNVLWDCIALLDPATEALVQALGGLSAIAISHPHYYTAMQDWSAAFAAPIHLHAADRDWIMRRSPSISLWEGDTLDLSPGLTLIRVGGHFPGGTVLHWATPSGGVLLAGDIVQVAPGAQRVSFMWSYPNMMPLPATEICRIAACLAPWRFERIYGAFVGQEVMRSGSNVVARSARRYIELLED